LNTGIRGTAHPATNRPRNAANFGFLNLTGNAGRLCHHPCLANLTARRVRDLAGSCFLSHGASRVGDSLGDRLAGPRASRIGDFLGDGLASPGTGGVRDSLGDRLTGPRAGGVRDSFRDALLFESSTSVRNLLHARHRNSFADCIGLLTVANFLHHARAAHGAHLSAGDPPAAADCPRSLAAPGAGA